MVPSLVYNVALLFIMMLPGIIMKKCKLAPDNFGKGISNIVLYIGQPALIFLAYVRPFDINILKNSAIVLGLSIVVHAIFTVAVLLLFKRAEDSARRMLRFATMFSNAAFMGVPLISAVLGAEATIYASVYNITFNMFLWTLGVYICAGDRDADGDGEPDSKRYGKVPIMKAIVHPITLAAFLGLLFFFLPIEGYIPKIVLESITMLKNLVAPLSMVVIGLRLAQMDLRGFFKDIHLYEFLALRHIILPLVVLLVMKLLILVGLPISYEVLMVTLILSAAPAATSATMFAEMYDCDAAYVSKLVAFSTLISVLTMPLIVTIATL